MMSDSGSRFGAGFATAIVLAVVAVWATTAWRADAQASPTEASIVAIDPERILDSRNPTDLGLPGPFVSAVSQKLMVTGSVPTSTGTKVVVPTGATGVLLNVTAIGATADGFLSVRPGDASGAPTTSSLNFTAGSTTPNAVQVALPVAGPEAGRIDIPYDALGVAGPTTDVLIDVVGYTTTAALDQKANRAEVYTRSQADAAFLPRGEIVLGHAPIFVNNATNGVPAIGYLASRTIVTAGSGFAQLAIDGPTKIGVANYGLKSVTYCIDNLTSNSFVGTADVFGVRFPEEPTNFVRDLTNRTEPGCYSLTVNDASVGGFTLSLEFFGAGTIDVLSVSSTWAPADQLV